VALAFAVVLALVVVILFRAKSAHDQVGTTPLLDKAAPAIDAATIDGRQFSLSAQRGRWVLVNFFASWCTTCKIEHPELVNLAGRHAAKGDLVVVSVATNDQLADTRKFFAANGGDWPVVLDPNGAIAVPYGLIQLPESYLVDPDGVVRVKFISVITADGVDKQIRSFTGGVS
jgi:cytochrome c biogenesis protein CcmG/thiol:disulfide interchange protein DsbE